MNDKKELVIGITAGIVGGLIAGGVLGILFAPQSGKDTRKEIKTNLDTLVQTVKSLPADARALFNKATIEDVRKK